MTLQVTEDGYRMRVEEVEVERRVLKKRIGDVGAKKRWSCSNAAL